MLTLPDVIHYVLHIRSGIQQAWNKKSCGKKCSCCRMHTHFIFDNSKLLCGQIAKHMNFFFITNYGYTNFCPVFFSVQKIDGWLFILNIQTTSGQNARMFTSQWHFKGILKDVFQASNIDTLMTVRINSGGVLFMDKLLDHWRLM